MDDRDEISLDLFGNAEEDFDFDSDYFTEENEEVKEYLNKLSKATTELSYLCQHMKWAQPKFE